MKKLIFLLLLATPLSAQTVAGDRFRLNTGPCTFTSNTGAPEGVRTGKVCDVYHRTDAPGGIYQKVSGTGNTGWAVIASFGTQTANFVYVGPTSGGAALPTFRTAVNLDIAPAGVALTRVDDTNVTLTLGGATTTALVNAASLTLGWTGTLAAPRGGTGQSSYAVGDVLYAPTTTTIGKLVAVATGQVLASAGVGVAPVYTAAPSLTSIGGAANLTLNPTGNVALNPVSDIVSIDAGLHVGGVSAPGDNNLLVDGTADVTGNAGVSGFLGHPNFVSQTTNWRVTAAGALDVRYLFTDELRAKIFTADLESVLAGSQRVTKSFSTISQTFTCPAASGTSTLWVKDAATFGDAAIFVSGDAVFIRSMTRTVFGPFTITDCVGVVTAYADGTGGNAGQQSWTFTRNAGGNAGNMTGSTTVAIDQLVQDMGVSGNGYVETSAVDGAAGVNAPYTQIVTWATAPVSANLTVRARLGNLLGVTGTAEYGLIAGTYAASNGQFFRASDQTFDIHGINLLMWDGATNVIKLDRTAPSFAIGSPVPTAYGTGTGIWMGKDTAYKFRVGVPGGAGVFWDGTTLNVSGSITVTGGNAETTTGAQSKADVAEADATAVANLKALKNLSDTSVNWAGSNALGGSANDTLAVDGTASATIEAGALRANIGLNSAGTVITKVIPASAVAPTGAGLYLGSDFMGYYSGSAWTTYMSNNGSFYLGGTSGSLQWNGTTLTIVGSVTATTGTIGGFSLGSDYIRDAGNSFGLASTVSGGDDVRFWAGDNFASRNGAPFRVTEAGALTATSGSIGGFSLDVDNLTDIPNTFGFSSVQTGADDVRIWAGDDFASRGSAPFRVTEGGAMTATIGSIGGWEISTVGIIRDTGTNSTSQGIVSDYPFYSGATYNNRATAPFRVTTAGLLTAVEATITNGQVNINTDGILIGAPGAGYASSYAYRIDTSFTGTNNYGVYAVEPAGGVARWLTLYNSTTATSKDIQTFVLAESATDTALITLIATTASSITLLADTITHTTPRMNVSGWTSATGGISTDTTDPGEGRLRVVTGNDGVVTLANTATSGDRSVLAYYDTGGLSGGLRENNNVFEIFTSSDRRLKEQIRPTRYGLDDLLKVNVRDFTFKSDEMKRSQTGFVAQELLAVYPLAVHVLPDPNEMLQVASGQLIPLLVRSVQQLTERVQALEKR